ncbi:hypothetical protein HELRODRAFT_160006 [Helobdella robusta]|uniref:Uncharacterized protein n=1 Tax=Helobdella robusta TaxID=6412 RepID=T1EPN3_HELRO|nr:hypothetical protein HELRODRAFT_160006 [Helobdella robusta]ESO05914.1 hypothetical protein HELRODRAFT_160006 [Helobdella robusta]
MNFSRNSCLIRDFLPRKEGPDCKIYECSPKQKVRDVLHVKDLISPPQLTKYHQFMLDTSECTYESRKHPLEKSTLSPPYAPCIDRMKTTFGVTSAKDISAKDLINPLISADQVACEGQRGHDLYTFTHKACD